MTQAPTLAPPSPAFIAPEPFSRRVERLERIAGLTVAEILVSAVGAAKIDLDDLDRVAVYENGVDLEELLGSREAVLDYVPTAGATLNLAVEPLGGGGGNGNKALQTVLTIAVIALSFYVGGGAATPALLDSLLVRTALAATVNVVGQMAISAAFGQNGAGGLAEANDRRALEGASNRFRPREPFPLQLGAAVVGADLAAAPYTQNIGDDTFLHVALGWHYGKAALSELKIGGTLIEDYPASDIEIEHFLTPGPRTSFLYPGRVIQENKSDELDQAGGGTWEVDTLAGSAERGEVDITFPNGIKYNADSGKVRDEEVSGRIEIAEVGTEAWLAPALDGSGVIGAGAWRVVARTNDAVRRTFGFALPDKTKLYKVRVKSFDHQNEFPSDDRTTGAYWTALRSIERRAPIVDETLAVSFMRIRSSDDLNGNLPTVTARIEPIVPVWNGDDWIEAPSSNAAALARWLLTGPAAAIPLRPDQVDDSFIAGFELIEAQEWEGAVSVTSEASQADVLRRLGRLGRFATYWSGRKLCLVTDWEKPAPRQVFAGRNAQGYRYRRMFPGPIHAVIVEFNNGEDENGSDEIVVYADGFTPANAELFETLRLDFSCDLDRAYREGRVFLAKRELQVEVHEWTAGADAIATTYGDRVLARHVSTLYGLADGRVDYRHWTGELVSGVRLDQAVQMEAGETYAIDVRRTDGVIRGIPVVAVAGTHRSLTFAAPLAADDAPMKGDLVVFGRTELVTEDVEIVDVEPAGGMTATFRALRYLAPEIMAAETGPVPPLTSGITPKAVAPRPRITSAAGAPEGATVAFEVEPIRGSMIEGFAARWRRSAAPGGALNPWSILPALTSTERVVRTPPIAAATAISGDDDGEYRIDVEIRTILRNGSVSPPAFANAILIERKIPSPTGAVALGQIRSAADGSSHPVLFVSVDPLEAGPVQDLVVEKKLASDGAGAWVPAGQALPALNPRGDFRNVVSGQVLDVRVRWRTDDNWPSPWVILPGVTIPARADVSFDVSPTSPVRELLLPIPDLIEDVGENGRRLLAEVLARSRRDRGDKRATVEREDVISESLIRVRETLELADGENVALIETVRQNVLDELEASTSVLTLQLSAFGDNLAAVETLSQTTATDLAAETLTRVIQASEFAGNLASVEALATTTATEFATEVEIRTELFASFNSNLGAVITLANVTATDLSVTTETFTQQYSQLGAALALAEESTTTLATAFSAEVTQRDAIFADFNSNLGAVISLSNVTATGLSVETTTRNEQYSEFNDNLAGAISTIQTVASDLATEVTEREEIFAGFNSNLGAVITLANVTATGLGVETTTRQEQYSQFDDALAGAIFEIATVADALSSEVSSRDELFAGFNANLGAVITLANVTANANAVLTETVDLLSADVDGLSATVTTTSLALVDIETQLAIASFRVAVEATGSDPAVLELVSGPGGGVIRLAANQIWFGGNTIFDDVTDTDQTTYGDGKMRVIAKGAPFGVVDSEFGLAVLVEWEGPAGTALSAMSRANAEYYRANRGTAAGGTRFPSSGGLVLNVPTGPVDMAVAGGGSVSSGPLTALLSSGNDGASVMWRRLSGSEAITISNPSAFTVSWSAIVPVGATLSSLWLAVATKDGIQSPAFVQVNARDSGT